MPRLLSPSLDADAAAVPHNAIVPQGTPMMACTQPHTPAPLTPLLFTYKHPLLLPLPTNDTPSILINHPQNHP
jgi:hypothetical protein